MSKLLYRREVTSVPRSRNLVSTLGHEILESMPGDRAVAAEGGAAVGPTPSEAALWGAVPAAETGPCVF